VIQHNYCCTHGLINFMCAESRLLGNTCTYSLLDHEYNSSCAESRLPGNTCTSSLLDHEYSSSCAESRLPGITK
jgi:hypothetical protein